MLAPACVDARTAWPAKNADLGELRAQRARQPGPAPRLVAPTGHYRAGTIRLHLVDPSRIDPTSPTHSVREIMVQVWYPATVTRVFPPTPYLTPLAAAHFLASFNLPADIMVPPLPGTPARRRTVGTARTRSCCTPPAGPPTAP
jgi:hypothetical protein